VFRLISLLACFYLVVDNSEQEGYTLQPPTHAPLTGTHTEGRTRSTVGTSTTMSLRRVGDRCTPDQGARSLGFLVNSETRHSHREDEQPISRKGCGELERPVICEPTLEWWGTAGVPYCTYE
jgi:hypothetical protein